MSTFPDDYDSHTRRRNLRLLLVSLAIVATAGVLFFFVATQPARSLMNSKRKLVEEFLAKYANDPASVSIQEVRYSPPATEDGHTVQYVFVAYRQRNRAGALSYEEDLLKLTDGRHLSAGAYERELLKASDVGRWSLDPSGR